MEISWVKNFDGAKIQTHVLPTHYVILLLTVLYPSVNLFDHFLISPVGPLLVASTLGDQAATIATYMVTGKLCPEPVHVWTASPAMPRYQDRLISHTLI